MKQISIFGTKLHDIPLIELIEYVIQNVLDQNKIVVSNLNINALNIAYENQNFRNCINQSDFVFCDGYGVILGSIILGNRIHNRYTPPDWIGNLINRGMTIDASYFFLGGKPNVADQAAQNLVKEYPSMKIVGTHHGYFEKSQQSSDNMNVINLINRARPNILFVGFGMPIQEEWIFENIDSLNVNVVFPVGAMFDFLSGETPRAPRWITDHGFEWLSRLIITPNRLWKRYLIGNPLFFYRILLQKFGLLRV